MIDIGETLAHPKDRYRAAAGAGGVVALALAAVPLMGRPLGESYPLLAIAIAVSAVMVLLAAVLLWAQSRVTASAPLLVLAAAYAAAGVAMIPYLLLHRGLWPQVAARIGATAQASAWLWVVWHLLLAASPLAYLAARRFLGSRKSRDFVRLQLQVGAIACAGIVALVALATWTNVLPPFSNGSSRSSVAYVCVAIVALVAVASIVSLYVQNRFRSILDVWLAIACLCMIADVLLWSGGAPFTVAWYVSRAYIVIASAMVLTALLLQTANVYAQLAATADRLRDESLTDALTGLANRRAFDERIAHVLADGERMSRGAALLMVDVDHFKLFNDTYGHLGGDECLRDLATTAHGCVARTRDLVARYGGEEFAVVMAETDLRGALIVAERIRSAIEGMGIPHSSRATHAAVTVSIGAVAVETTAGLTADAFVARADAALYRAKQLGRNRTVSWPLDEPAVAGQMEATANARGTDAGSRATIS